MLIISSEGDCGGPEVIETFMEMFKIFSICFGIDHDNNQDIKSSDMSMNQERSYVKKSRVSFEDNDIRTDFVL